MLSGDRPPVPAGAVLRPRPGGHAPAPLLRDLRAAGAGGLGGPSAWYADT
ncbi:MAG: hypothetical protein R2731_06970 [Nocardioides sp.]